MYYRKLKITALIAAMFAAVVFNVVADNKLKEPVA